MTSYYICDITVTSLFGFHYFTWLPWIQCNCCVPTAIFRIRSRASGLYFHLLFCSLLVLGVHNQWLPLVPLPPPMCTSQWLPLHIHLRPVSGLGEWPVSGVSRWTEGGTVHARIPFYCVLELKQISWSTGYLFYKTSSRCHQATLNILLAHFE